ncbi:MAG: hypothetical protein J6Y10_02290 [Lachnospiraceae bacterium]|nr:hypothetical protein [Lachnospiraceae bacterium]
MIKHFERIEGSFIEKIYGQERLAYAHSDSSDLYALAEWAERGGYPGSVILFYDYANGAVYRPFRKRKNVLYSNPAFADGAYWFLQGDYGKRKVTLFSYHPGEKPAEVTSFSVDEVSLYNLRILGEKVHVVSQNGETAECVYPERFTLSLTPHQTVELIADGRVYLEEWVEEGWDPENDCATEKYRFYHKVVVKDFQGNTLSEEVGSITQAPDGTYWIS